MKYLKLFEELHNLSKVLSFNYKLFKSADIEADKITDDFNLRMIKLEIEFKREFK